eukprot:767623-Hanusia_phi.AAC.2
MASTPKKNFVQSGTPTGNRTRVSPVAGAYSTTRPSVYGAVMPLTFDSRPVPIPQYIDWIWV